jgi:cystathionine beta-lyase
MKYNFDTEIDRRSSGSVKWNKYAGRDIIPMWVADMDFRTPEAITDAMHRHLDHGILGYTEAPDAFFDVIMSMLQRLYGWKVEREWIVPLPSLVPGLHGTCRSVCAPGETVLTLTPVYSLFFPVAPLAGCIQ